MFRDWSLEVCDKFLQIVDSTKSTECQKAFFIIMSLGYFDSVGCLSVDLRPIRVLFNFKRTTSFVCNDLSICPKFGEESSGSRLMLRQLPSLSSQLKLEA